MSSAIRDAGLTLIELLRDNLVRNPIDPTHPIQFPNQIGLLSPRDVSQNADVRLSLFLYSITPSAELRNELEIPGNTMFPGEISEPLDLHFLLTAFSPLNDVTERTLDEHLLLGFAMRVFFDNGILVGSMLHGNLPRDEELRLTLQPMTIEDLTRIWSVFPDSVLHASASFLLTPVRLRSTRTLGGARVSSRQTDVDQVVPIRNEEEAA